MPIFQGTFRKMHTHAALAQTYRPPRAHRSHRWGHRFESCCDHHQRTPILIQCRCPFSFCLFRHIADLGDILRKAGEITIAKPALLKIQKQHIPGELFCPARGCAAKPYPSSFPCTKCSIVTPSCRRMISRPSSKIQRYAPHRLRSGVFA